MHLETSIFFGRFLIQILKTDLRVNLLICVKNAADFDVIFQASVLRSQLLSLFFLVIVAAAVVECVSSSVSARQSSPLSEDLICVIITVIIIK